MVEQRFKSRLLFNQYLMTACVAGMKRRGETAGLIPALLKLMIFRSLSDSKVHGFDINIIILP